MKGEYAEGRARLYPEMHSEWTRGNRDKLQQAKFSVSLVEHRNRGSEQWHNLHTENFKMLKLALPGAAGGTWQPPFQPKLLRDARNKPNPSKAHG